MGWKGFRVRGELDLSLIGVLAKIAKVLADIEISILVLSTYNADYILVKKDSLPPAIDALKKAGYTIA